MIEAFFGVVGVVACIGIVVGALVLVAKYWVAFCDWKWTVDQQLRTLDERDVRLDLMDVRGRIAKLDGETIKPAVISELAKRIEKLEASDKLTDEAVGSLRNRQNAQDAAISRLERERMERVHG